VILVDTSVWIDHFRATDAALVELLMNGRSFSKARRRSKQFRSQPEISLPLRA